MMRMILIVTNKEDITVDFVIQELKRKKHNYYRLNTEDIPSIVKVRFDISQSNYILWDSLKEEKIDLSTVSAVYFRRPKISNLSYIPDINDTERTYLRNELLSVLEGIYKSLDKVFWINDVYKIREAENKIYQLQLAKKIGFHIPESFISNCLDDINSMIKKCEESCVLKPIRTGSLNYSDNSQIIFTSELQIESITQERINSFPIFVQEKIEKAFDIRCIVVGEKVFAAEIHSQNSQDGKIDWRKAKEYLIHRKIDLPQEIKTKAIEITQALGLTFSAIDFVCDKKGNYIFLECNPNGQWAWIETRLGYPISEEIVNVLARTFNEKDLHK